MIACKECGSRYVTGKLDFCSMSCFRKNVEKRVNDALKNDKSHKKNFLKINLEEKLFYL